MPNLNPGKPWLRPVRIEMDSGSLPKITNTAEASAWQRDRWPSSGQDAREHALEICGHVFEGRLGPRWRATLLLPQPTPPIFTLADDRLCLPEESCPKRLPLVPLTPKNDGDSLDHRCGRGAAMSLLNLCPLSKGKAYATAPTTRRYECN